MDGWTQKVEVEWRMEWSLEGGHVFVLKRHTAPAFLVKKAGIISHLFYKLMVVFGFSSSLQ